MDAVSVEIASGAVVVLGGSWVGMAGQDLGIAEGAPASSVNGHRVRRSASSTCASAQIYSVIRRMRSLGVTGSAGRSSRARRGGRRVWR